MRVGLFHFIYYMSFTSLSLTDPILRSLNKEGYSEPTPIQAQSIPIALQGRDLLASAQTGTGKTASFAIPVLQNLGTTQPNRGRKPIRSLVLTPTRELAIQIDESFRRYGRYTDLKTVVIFGGVNQKSQVRKLKQGVDIVVATPGRLLDLMNQGHLSLSDVEILVLDEADRMLDMGFIHDIKKVIKAVPKERQTLFFSATMPPAIVQLSKSMLHNPAKVEIEPESPTVEAIQQGVYHVEKSNKKTLLVSLLNDPEIPSALVFTRTKHGANKVVKLLNSKKIGAEAIHGNKSQAARQKALGNFKAQKTRVLVATDIAARGIDVDELKYVINFDLPNEAETYVHRIGRTGRAGSDGTALSFCDTSERSYLRDIEKLISKQVPVVEHPELTIEAPQPGRPGTRPGSKGSRSRSKSKRQQRSRRPRSGNRQRSRS